MKIIDAFWEQKNLGLTTTEILFEASDNTLDSKSFSEVCSSADYVVAKVPTGRFDLSSQLSEYGFVFIESSINFRLDVKNAFLTPLQRRLNEAVSYQEMDLEDIAELNRELEKGLFKTDRIVLDPFFSNSLAANRYKNWIADECKREATLYKILYKQNAIGFFTFKQMPNGTFYPFLAGLYENYSKSGLGFETLRKPIEEVINRGGGIISTYASSNNLPVIRAHEQQGFQIFEITNVFVKHNTKK